MEISKINPIIYDNLKQIFIEEDNFKLFSDGTNQHLLIRKLGQKRFKFIELNQQGRYELITDQKRFEEINNRIKAGTKVVLKIVNPDGSDIPGKTWVKLFSIFFLFLFYSCSNPTGPGNNTSNNNNLLFEKSGQVISNYLHNSVDTILSINFQNSSQIEIKCDIQGTSNSYFHFHNSDTLNYFYCEGANYFGSYDTTINILNNHNPANSIIEIGSSPGSWITISNLKIYKKQ